MKLDFCVSTGILTFVVVLYCCIGVDFLPNFINEDLVDNPLFKFVILALMALVFCHDHYIAILIGFSYMLTKLTLLNNRLALSQNSDNDSKPVNPLPLSDVEELQESEKIDETQVFPEELDEELVKELDSIQSNITNESASKTEVRTWNDGYGTQGGYR